MSDASIPPRPCDCLDRCGDDPRLGRGAVAPCQAAQARRLAYLEAIDREVKVKSRLAELGFGTDGLLEALEELKSFRRRDDLLCPSCGRAKEGECLCGARFHSDDIDKE